MERPVHFKNLQGEQLTGTLHLPDTATDRGIVLAHCFTCSRHTGILRQLGHDFAQAGFMALRFDFSGNGQSEGDFAQSTYTKQISEMKIAGDVISSQGASRIGLAGHSMGAVIALLAAVEIKTATAVCAIAGRLSGMNAMRFLNRPQRDELDQTGRGRLSGMNAMRFLNRPQRDELDQTGRVAFTSRGRQLMLTQDFFSDADRFDLPALVSRLKIPLLIVHGDRDEIIPVDEAYSAHEPNSEKIDMTIISGADHMFSNKKHRLNVSEKIVGWFNNQF